MLGFINVEVYMYEIRRDSYPRETDFVKRVEDYVSASAVTTFNIRC